MQPTVAQLTDRLIASYASAGGINHLDGKNLPSKRAITHITENLLRLLFPGYFDEKLIHSSEIKTETSALLETVLSSLEEEIRKSLEYNPPQELSGSTDLRHAARSLTLEFLESLPRIREILQTDGKGMPPVEILYNTLEYHRTIAEAIQQMWKTKLGVDARLVNQEWKVYLDSQRSLNYQVCRAGWTGDYNDPNSFLDMLTSGSGNNETGWSNPEYDRLIAQAAATADPQQRLEVFQKAEALLMDEMPIIPIYFYTHVCLKRPELKGWYPNVLDNHPYKYMYLEPSKK